MKPNNKEMTAIIAARMNPKTHTLAEKIAERIIRESDKHVGDDGELTLTVGELTGLIREELLGSDLVSAADEMAEAYIQGYNDERGSLDHACPECLEISEQLREAIRTLRG